MSDGRKIQKAIDISREQRWNANFKKLEKYITRHGTWRVKKNHDLRLSEWLKRQKRNYENLSIERRRKLERIGVKGTYQIANEAWNSKYEEARLFKKTHGHLVVGKTNKSLFEWIQNQKWMKNQGGNSEQVDHLIPRQSDHLKLTGKLWLNQYRVFG